MKTGKKHLLLLALVLVAALLFSSAPAFGRHSHDRGKSLEEARRALEQELFSLAGTGFTGIAHSEDEGEIIVFVQDEQAKGRVSQSFEGHPVRVEVTGKIETLTAQVVEPVTDVGEERQDVVRPLVGGISLSAYVTKGAQIYLYAGTLGMVTYNNKVLSNAHVIAMEPGTNKFLDTGTPIIQPGSGDGGGSGDRVGELEAYIPIDFGEGAQNYADAAIGSIDTGVGVSPGEQFDEGGNYRIEGWVEVSKGNNVRKSGRTTGVTTGEVIYANASVWVKYGDKSAYFVDQIQVAQENWSFAGRGDSGSAVDRGGEFVGLVFAGSETHAFINKAEHIIAELGIAVEPAEGWHSLTISCATGGSVTEPGEGTFIYEADDVVDLVAAPDGYYRFKEWTGDVATVADVHAAETTIATNSSYSITANFELEEGWCSLTVSSTPGGSVNIPGEGMFIRETDTVVDLVAGVDLHYRFVRWTGDVDTIGDIYAAATNITMHASYSIAASFELEEGWCSLSISSTPGGDVIEPGEGMFIRETDTVVDLVAVADEGYQFVKWTGDVDTIGDAYAAATNITMQGSYSITADFESWHPDPTALLGVSSTAGGSVTVPGEGIFSYAFGIEVDLNAEPDEGYRFINWSGDVDTIADVSVASTTIIMDSSYSVTASFADSRCFIATAAYGSPMADEIQILREFRDGYLVTNLAGKALVDLYYRVSPAIAEFITEHPGLKPTVRAGLVPAIAMSTVVVNAAPAEKTAAIGMLVLVSVAVAVWAAKRRGRGPEYARG